jgi:protein SCO1/2
MPEAQYMNLKLVFVSVDPDRDEPAKIKNYLKNFDSKIIGVTGLSNQD